MDPDYQARLLEWYTLLAPRSPPTDEMVHRHEGLQQDMTSTLEVIRRQCRTDPKARGGILCSRNQPPGPSFSWVLSAFQPCFCSSPSTRYDASRRRRNSRT